MAVKKLSTQELSYATYGKFGRTGVTVDVRGFLKTSDGQKLLRDVHRAAASQMKNGRHKDK